jgi:threonine-phosphate decarboxylase
MKPMEHGGNVWRYSEEWGQPRSELIDFSANINPLGPPPGAEKAASEAWQRVSDYPDPEYTRLRGIIAETWDIPVGRILVGNGAAELIFLAMEVLRPASVLSLAPAFREYEQAAQCLGAKIVRIPLRPEDGFAFPRDAVLDALRQITPDLLVLANPNNPTGRCVPPDDLTAILEEAGRCGVPVLLDEAFLDFLADDRERSAIPRTGRFPLLIVLRSLTKFYSVPGLRIGYAVAFEALRDKMAARQIPWPVNAIAEAVAAVLLGDRMFRQRTLAWLERERPWLAGQLAQEGWTVIPSDANFLLCRRDGFDIRSDWGRIGAKGIFVRDCRSFQGLDHSWMRVAVRLRRENEALLDALRSL